MIRVKYNIQFKKQTISPILISITWKGNRIQKSIGKSVETEKWDFKRNRLKSSHPNALNFNKYLQDLETNLTKYYYQFANSGKEVTKNQLKEKLTELLNNGIKPENKDSTLVEVFEKFKSEYRVDGKKPKQKTLDNYTNTINKLNRYEEKFNTTLSFEDIDIDFYNNFVNYLFEKGNNNNTVGTNIRFLKKFMKWAMKKKYHNNTEYEDFKVLKSEALNNMVLTKDELRRLDDLDLENNELEFSRLFLLTNCTIGLRASDLFEIIKEFDINKGFKSLIQVKTGMKQQISVTDKVKERINMLKELYQPDYTLDLVNNSLKEVGKLAGLDETETIVNNIGNERKYIKKKRWELLTTHVGRRTFATLSLQNGVPIGTIMKYTGHKTLTSFQIYINNIDLADDRTLTDLW